MVVKSKSKKTTGSVAELFAGVGGFRLGLEAAGLKIVYSNQYEPSTKKQYASDVYVKNFGSDGHENLDIAKVDKVDSKFDVLVGGFPCQDYSVAKSKNSSHGIKGKKGVLWWEILRIAEKHKPKFIFLENVDRLLKSPSNQKGRDFAVMLKTLSDAGYTAEWRVINSADYGFPQRRLRTYIVARRDGKYRGKSHLDIVVKAGVLAKSFPHTIDKSTISEFPLSDSAEKLSKKFGLNNKKSSFLNCGYFDGKTVFTVKTKAKYSGIHQSLGDIILPDSAIPSEFWISNKDLKAWKDLKGAKKILRKHKTTGFEYFYSEGSMSFPDSLKNPSRTILTGEGGTSPSRFKHVIKTKKGFRRLTPLELERLNGFPDDWTKFGQENQIVSDTTRAFLMGNALVIGLIERVGSVLAKELRQSKK